MKPPHSNRPGGSSRPPSDRGPVRGAGGPSKRPQGQGPHGQGPRGQGPQGQGSQGQGSRGQAAPQGQGSPATRQEGHRGAGATGEPRQSGGFPGRHAEHKSASGGSRSDGPRAAATHASGPGHAKRGSGQTGGDRTGPRFGQSSGARSDFVARVRTAPRTDPDTAPDALPDAAGSAGHDGDHQAPRPANGGKFHRPDRERQTQRSAAPRPQYHDADRHGPDAPKGALWLYGHHAIVAALANPSRRLRRLLLTAEAESALSKLLPQPWPLAAERVDRPRLDQLLGRDIVHQGSALLADPLAPPSLQSVLERPGPIIVLDQVSDPRNVGAIMRSAAAFGAAAVIAQDRNAPEENGALAKAASGALETMPLLRAVNIARTLIALKAANIWCVGLDAGGSTLSAAAIGDRRVALVLGAEGDGLRRLTRETCDEVAGLTIKGGVDSLNVSAAAAVAMYEITRKP